MSEDVPENTNSFFRVSHQFKDTAESMLAAWDEGLHGVVSEHQ